MAVAWRGRNVSRLPNGIEPTLGPLLIVAASYATSPVGPYLELAVGQPARLGARFGSCVTTMIVDSAAPRDAGRRHWGFPKELGSLSWSVDGEDRTLRWEERGLVIRSHPIGPSLPAFVPYVSLQQRADGPVSVSGRLRGRARLSRVELSVPAGDPLAVLDGRYSGAMVAEAKVTMSQARRI